MVTLSVTEGTEVPVAAALPRAVSFLLSVSDVVSIGQFHVIVGTLLVTDVPDKSVLGAIWTFASAIASVTAF